MRCSPKSRHASWLPSPLANLTPDDSGNHFSMMASTESPTVGSTIARVTRQLADAGIPDAGIEARTLIKAVLGLTSTSLLTDRDRRVSEAELATLDALVELRLKREPLQYITGEVEFYGRAFNVDQRVLIPRPETELLVEQALAYLAEKTIERPRVLDIGTGSGVLAVTLAAELPLASVVATDIISTDALGVALPNARSHRVDDRIEFVQCPFADEVEGRFDIVVCNPPYVLSSFLDGPEAQPELGFEPRTALDGGADGMDVYRPLLARLPGLLKPGGAAFIEIDPPVVESCVAAAKQHLPHTTVSVLTDLAGLERCLVIETTS